MVTAVLIALPELAAFYGGREASGDAGGVRRHRDRDHGEAIAPASWASAILIACAPPRAREPGRCNPGDPRPACLPGSRPAVGRRNAPAEFLILGRADGTAKCQIEVFDNAWGRIVPSA